MDPPGSRSTAVVVEPAVGPAAPPVLSKRSVAASVARRGGPKLIEANLVPAAILYVCLAHGAVGLGYLGAIVWVYGSILRRMAGRRSVPVVLVLAALGLTLRTIIAVCSGSTFVYFAQPILVTVATGGLFLSSLFVGRPIIERLAGDFWPVTPEMASNPRVHSLFRGLTVLWAGVNLATATVTFLLLLWLPVTTFLPAKQATGMAISIAAIALTIIWSHRIACAEGMVRSPVARRDREDRRPPTDGP